MIELKNEQLKVQINPLGAEVHSVQYQGREYLWQGDSASWGRQAPNLFPIVGRLKDNVYRYKEQEYTLTQHGFARDMVFTVLSQTATQVCLQLQSNSTTRQRYPFEFDFRVTYQLQARQLQVRYAVKNPSETATMLYSLGAHPGFRVPLTTAGEFETTYVSVSPAQVYGQVHLVGPHSDLAHLGRLDFTKAMALRHDLFVNDALILATAGQPTTVTLTEQASGHGLQVINHDAPYVALWSAYPAQGDFVCVESWWGLADSLTSDGQLVNKAAILRLAPGLTNHHRYEVAFF